MRTGSSGLSTLLFGFLFTLYFGGTGLHAIGMRHDVEESAFVALANNEGRFVAGIGPGFRSGAPGGLPNGISLEPEGVGEGKRGDLGGRRTI